MSVFVHVTVAPTATISSPGLKAFRPSDSAFLGIVMADDPDGAGAVGAGAIGDGVVGETVEGEE
jgi:hypothetical protein